MLLTLEDVKVDVGADVGVDVSGDVDVDVGMDVDVDVDEVIVWTDVSLTGSKVDRDVDISIEGC